MKKKIKKKTRKNTTKFNVVFLASQRQTDIQTMNNILKNRKYFQKMTSLTKND